MTIELTAHVRKQMPVATLTDPKIVGPAIIDAFRKLHPRVMVRKPVMFTVEIVATLTTILFVRDLIVGKVLGFALQINLWLWFTVLFANFAEAVAEGRGKAQAATLRRTKTETMAKRFSDAAATKWESVPEPEVHKNDLVLVEAGDLIPSDGKVIEGVASVNGGRHHRRVRFRDPRERRRPFSGDRRHAGDLRLDQGAHHGDRPHRHVGSGELQHGAVAASRQRRQGRSGARWRAGPGDHGHRHGREGPAGADRRQRARAAEPPRRDRHPVRRRNSV
jgi:hypothetical protein